MNYLHRSEEQAEEGIPYLDKQTAEKVRDLWNTFTPEACTHAATPCAICASMYRVTTIKEKK